MKTQTLSKDLLRIASVEITQRCNNRCPYCDQSKSDRDMSLCQFSDILAALIQEGVEAVALGGGEPTLHPDLPSLLLAARNQGLPAGLTTNARDPRLVMDLVDAGLLDSFGVSAGKGLWTALVSHPKATVNLLLLREGSKHVMTWAVEAIQQGSRRLLLLGYKGIRYELSPSLTELAETFAMVNQLGRSGGAVVAADDSTRRRLGLTKECGQGFIRVRLDGTRERCCFPDCEFRR